MSDLISTTSDNRPRNIRRPSFCKTLTSDDNYLSTSGLITTMTASGKRSVKEQVWKPREANTAGKENKQKANIIDRKSLYSIKREHIAARDMSFLARPPSRHGDSSSLNIEHLIEKNYIINSRLKNATPEKFPKVIMRHFHRVSSTTKDVMYGMPRPPTRETNPIKIIMEGIRREPSIVRIDQYPSLQEPVKCDETDEFCEILGPSSCQNCIECTNRHIGEKLQHMVFPTIDITADKLIYPKMAQLLTDGHRLQVRKRRMREMGIDMPFDLINFRRRETPLSTSTCLSCKKPIHIPEMKISTSSEEQVEAKGRKVPKTINTARI